METKSNMQLYMEAQNREPVKSFESDEYDDMRRPRESVSAFMKEGVGYYPRSKALEIPAHIAVRT